MADLLQLPDEPGAADLQKLETDATIALVVAMVGLMSCMPIAPLGIWLLRRSQARMDHWRIPPPSLHGVALGLSIVSTVLVVGVWGIGLLMALSQVLCLVIYMVMVMLSVGVALVGGS